MTVKEFQGLADRLADTARAIIRDGRDRLAMEIKSDGSPVTAIDRAVEEALRTILTTEVPDHGVLGEEFGAEGLDREFVWVLDPIDGTKHFAAGLPNFGVLIALCQNQVPRLGIIEQPFTEERYLGLSGEGCWMNGRSIRCGGQDSLAESVAVLCGPDDCGAALTPGYDRLRRATRWNLYDTGCLGYGSLARGSVDLALNGPNLDAFDICALVPVIEGAGGRISGCDGSPLTLDSAGAILAAASDTLHEKALGLLA